MKKKRKGQSSAELAGAEGKADHKKKRALRPRGPKGLRAMKQLLEQKEEELQSTREILARQKEELQLIKAELRRERLRYHMLFDLDERKQTEAELRESETTLRLAVETAELGTYERNVVTNRVSMNPECRKIMGVLNEPLPPDLAYRSVHPEDEQRVLAAVKRAFDPALREVCGAEFRILRPDGTLRWIAGRGRVLFDDTVSPPRPNKFLGVISDVTQRKLVEEALRESEERFRAFFHTAAVGTAEMDLDGRFLEVNDQFCRITGYSREEMLHMRPSDLWHPDNHERHSRNLAAHLIGRIPSFEEEKRYVRKDGQEVWALVTAALIRDAAGKPLRSVGIVQDITERKQAEEALRQLHQRLSYHLQNTPLAVVEFDSEFRISGWSGGARRIFGWESSEVLGRSVWDLPWICQADLDKVQAVAAGLVSGQTLRSASPNRNVRKDGKVIWCEWYNSALTDASGKMQSVQSLVLDVTERREAEVALHEAQDQLRRHAEDLGKTVQERTAELRKTIGDLEHFSYSITHDMRAPLRAMRSYSSLLLDEFSGSLPPMSQDFLKRIATAADRMDQLIEDALDYNKALREELRLNPVDTGALLRGMVESYPAFQSPKAQVRLEGSLPLVRANQAGLTQCFSNLLNNAVKFVQPGQVPQVRVWAESRASGVRLWFEDNGIGIAAESQARIFDMFQRLSREYEGTGIGLALVRKVIEKMGGRVGVESEPGRGSRFWLELSPASQGDCL